VVAERIVEADPSIGAIVCECTNITPYSHEINRRPRRAGVRHGHARAPVPSGAAARGIFRRIDRKTDCKRDRLDRRLHAQPSDRFERHVEPMRRQLGGREAAEAALTPPHAAAGDGLEAVDLGWAEIRADRGAQVAGRNIFTAANRDIIIKIADDVGGPGERTREPALETAQPRDLPAQARPVDAGDRPLEVFEHCACRKRTGEGGGLRAADGCAVTGDVDIVAASSIGRRPAATIGARADRSETPRPRVRQAAFRV